MTVTVTAGADDTDTNVTVMLTLTSTYLLGTSSSQQQTVTVTPANNQPQTVTAPQNLYEQTTVITIPKPATSTTSTAPTVSATLAGQVIITAQPTPTAILVDTAVSGSNIPVQSSSHTSQFSSTASSSISSTSTSSIAMVTNNTTPTGSSSLRLGLAIGLPVSIVGFLIILVLSFIVIKKHKFKNTQEKMLTYQSQFYNYNGQDVESEKTMNENNHGVDLEANQQSIPKRRSLGYMLKDRFSRIIRADDVPSLQETSILPQPRKQWRDSIISPMILKRFNLSRPSPAAGNKKEVSADSTPIESKVLSIPLNEQSSRHKRNFSLPPIVVPEKSLDPLSGGISNSIHYDDKKYIVIKAYSKNLDDELTIRTGDMVVMLTEHSDGWCKVKLIRKGAEYYGSINAKDEGMVPRLCLQKL
ncbi:uncharacterized protein RJT21DRAFT_128864 [Scheffersomyces amazonensis]|uniref:uncharacterized protein n=1 Tax=Scheffersomyces amazonensis TaxID=1078765 RepID=UPI00315D4AE1